MKYFRTILIYEIIFFHDFLKFSFLILFCMIFLVWFSKKKTSVSCFYSEYPFIYPFYVVGKNLSCMACYTFTVFIIINHSFIFFKYFIQIISQFYFRWRSTYASTYVVAYLSRYFPNVYLYFKLLNYVISNYNLILHK